MSNWAVPDGPETAMSCWLIIVLTLGTALLCMSEAAVFHRLREGHDTSRSQACRSHRFLKCVNKTHFTRHDAHSGVLCDIGRCMAGFSCMGASCRGESLADHILRAADFQIVESVPVSQLNSCSASQAADVAAGLMLCDVWHSTKTAQPTFGHILGNTWVHFGFGPGADAAPCNSTPAAWRACFGKNIGQMVTALQAESPHLLFSGGLMEFLTAPNLDSVTDFPGSACVPGSQGAWGDNTTCIPDITRAAAQEYYIDWGRNFLDGGIRAIFFGQARLTGGSSPDDSDDVSPQGAAGFKIVIDTLRAYALQKGYGDVYFGPQAAAAITLANGINVADWAYGAQHLEPHGGFLTLPTLRNGSYVATSQRVYGPGDFHDASLSNSGGRSSTSSSNSSSTCVVLDYDNFSGDPLIYDDIRRLAAVNSTRARCQLITDHYRYLRSYNYRAVVSIPFSKVLTVPAECSCYANVSAPIWGAGSMYFSAFACGLVETAASLWDSPYLGPRDGGVSADFLGQQLQGAGDTAVFVFAAMLNRNFTSKAEYTDAILTLPPRLYAAQGPRCDFIRTVLSSAEFNSLICPATPGSHEGAECRIAAIHRAVILSECSPGELTMLGDQVVRGLLSLEEVLQLFCSEADAAGLYNQTL